MSGDKRFTLVIHGGAGTISRGLDARQHKAALKKSLKAGERILRAGGSALDAVVAAVRVMEDYPLFNAGVGAVYTHDGTHELDASVMEGVYRRAGAVAAVMTIKNPIEAARLVMEKTPHVMLAGRGAEQFATEQGCIMVPNTYFDTEHRKSQLLDVIREEAQKSTLHTQLDHSVSPSIASSVVPLSAPSTAARSPAPTPSPDMPYKYGTVGAVARDSYGNVAAATSTGGMTNKRWGRVGDSPCIGAGTYADNATAAVSCTGHGEYFMRGMAAYDVCAAIEYKGLSLEQAANYVVRERFRQFHLPRLGGLATPAEHQAWSTEAAQTMPMEFKGDLIAVDAQGNFAFPYNSLGMYRGVVTDSVLAQVQVWDET